MIQNSMLQGLWVILPIFIVGINYILPFSSFKFYGLLCIVMIRIFLLLLFCFVQVFAYEHINLIAYKFFWRHHDNGWTHVKLYQMQGIT
jgi:hypothetical protein